MVGFIVAAALLVIALVFGIWSFVGKNDESDKKDKAQKELASTKSELGTSQGAANLLGDLVAKGETASTDLAACTDSDTDLENTIGDTFSSMLDAFNAVQAGQNVDAQLPALNAKIDAARAKIDPNKRVCDKASSSNKDFTDALARLKSGSQ